MLNLEYVLVYMYCIVSPPLLSWSPTHFVLGALTSGESSRGVKLTMTTLLHLVLRLRMHRAIPLLPQYILTVWCLIK